MPPWLSTLARLGSEAARAEVRRLGIALAIGVAGAALALTAVGFATAGVHEAIRDDLGPVAASFIVAGIFAALAAIAFAVAVRRRRPSRRRRFRRARTVDLTGDIARLEALGAVAAAFGFGLAAGLLRRRPR